MSAQLLNAAEPGTPPQPLEKALDLLYRMDYAAAEEAVLKGLPPVSPARPYFAAAVCVNRFLDWGDTAALSRAERYLEKISPDGAGKDAGKSPPFKGSPEEIRLYRGLAGFQQSYVASLRGHRLRPAVLARAARQQLQPLDRPEARANLMLYDYYKGQILGKLPFVNGVVFPVAEFRAAAEASPYLREMFLSSLFWVILEEAKANQDAARFAQALRIPDEFLERYPQNRLTREMRGSGLYRAGRYQEARLVFESLRDDYAGLPKSNHLPLGYYRAVGNLTRAYAALGMRAETEARLAEWNRAGRTGVAPWMPHSLKSDLEDLTRSAK